MKLLKLLVILLAISSTVILAAPSGVTDKLVAELKANLAFNTPESMSYDETQPIQLILDAERITDEVKALLKDSETAAQVQVSLQGYGFKITPASPGTQALVTNKPTEWHWDVTPTVKQNTTLKLYLSVNVLMKLDGAQTSRRVESFQREIKVNFTAKDSLRLPSAAPAAPAAAPVVPRIATPSPPPPMAAPAPATALLCRRWQHRLPQPGKMAR